MTLLIATPQATHHPSPLTAFTLIQEANITLESSTTPSHHPSPSPKTPSITKRRPSAPPTPLAAYWVFLGHKAPGGGTTSPPGASKGVGPAVQSRREAEKKIYNLALKEERPAAHLWKRLIIVKKYELNFFPRCFGGHDY